MKRISYFLTIIIFLFTANLFANGQSDVSVKPLIVDDFEDGNAFDYVNGEWKAYAHKSDTETSTVAMTTTASPGAGGSRYCLHITYQLSSAEDAWAYFHNWEDRTLDISPYHGVRFKARGKGEFFVSLQTKATVTTNNPYGSNIINLTPEWRVYEFSFSSLRQIFSKSKEKWDPKTLLFIGFSFDKPYTTTVAGEIFLDDIEFYPLEPENEQKTKEIAQKKLSSLDGKRLAILDVTSKNVDEITTATLLDFITNSFVNLASTTVIDRQNINKILKEQELQLEDFMDAHTATRIGNLLGAEFIATANINMLGETYYLTIRLIKVETGEIIGISTSAANINSEFFNMCSDCVKKMF